MEVIELEKKLEVTNFLKVFSYLRKNCEIGQNLVFVDTTNILNEDKDRHNRLKGRKNL